MYTSLQNFIEVLESTGELVRIKEFVSPHLEVSEITDRVVKNNGKALLFMNNGTEFPLLINALGSERRMCLALGVNSLSEITDELNRLLSNFLSPKETFLEKLKVIPALQQVSSWMPRSVSGKGPCQEVIMDTPDLTRIPVLTCWPYDGGPFITLPVVHTRDPENNSRNVGMYRMHVLDRDMTGMHWHLHKGSAHHYMKYLKLGKKMPVSVILGGDPVYTYVATAPLPENMDEYLFAGFLRKKKVELVKCLTNDLEVPSDADFVIEGYVNPQEELVLEGPFGDHTGFYSLADYYPKFHVTCITHRQNAIYPTIIVGIPPMEDGSLGKVTERIFLLPMRKTVASELVDLDMPVAGTFHNLALSSIEKSFPAQAVKVMNALWGAGQMMFNKILVMTDQEVDIHNYLQVARIVSENIDPLLDIHFLQGPVDVLDHSSSRFASGSKMGIDATKKLESEFRKNKSPQITQITQIKSIKENFPAILEVYDGYLADGISLVVITIQKCRGVGIKEIAKELVVNGLISGIKFIIWVDPGIELGNPSDLIWIVTNNIDPRRDCFFINGKEDTYPGIFIDGTKKTLLQDNFTREWPNVITMDDETIRKIDEKWNSFKIGPFLESPSLHYRNLVSGSGAVAEPKAGKN